MIRHATSNRNGVTLMEVLLVIMILAASATIGAFRVSGDHGVGRETRAASDQIVELLRTARMTALAKQSTVTLRRRYVPRQQAGAIDIPAHWVIELGEQPSPIPSLQGRGREVREPLQTVVSLSPEIRLLGTPAVIAFDSTGSTPRSAAWTITSRHADRRGLHDVEIILDPITGLAQTTATRL